MNITGIRIFLFLLCACFCQAAEPAGNDLKQMKAKADEVIKLSPTQGRAEVGVVFDFAEALKKAGREKEALNYYQAGLRCHAWALQHQLAYAQLLMKHGQKELARERARLVAQFAEEERLVVQALRLLGKNKEADRTLPPIGKIKGSDYVLVLVPMGEVNILLLKDVRAALQKELGITVLIQKAEVKMPGPGREPLKQYLEKVRSNIMKNQNDKDVQRVLKELKLTPDDLKKDAVFVRFFRRFLTRVADEAAAEEFILLCEELAEECKQWNATELMEVLKSTVRPYERDNVRYVGVTKQDMYGKDTSFLFGTGYLGERAVMSYRRFMAEFNKEVPNRKRLTERTIKQCLASAGVVFGLGHCSNPTCARAYPHSVMEHDAKLPKLCPACRKALRRLTEKKK